MEYSTGGYWMCPGCLRWVSDGSIHNCQGETQAHHKPLVGGEVSPKETHDNIMKSLEHLGVPTNQQQVGGAYEPRAACAHLIVGYVRQYLGGGRERGWWQCAECDCKFVPSGTTKA